MEEQQVKKRKKTYELSEEEKLLIKKRDFLKDRPKIYTDINQNYIYKHYKQNHFDPKMTMLTFGSILRDYYKEISRMIIEEGFEYKLPYGIGSLTVKMFKPKISIRNNEIVKNKLRVDWCSTIKLYQKMYNEEHLSYTEAKKKIKEDKDKGRKVKLIYHFNEHTDGKVYRFLWEKGLLTFIKNMIFYCFKTSNSSKKKLSIHIKNNSKLPYQESLNKYKKIDTRYAGNR